jgi:23S rRNA (cytidine1920-2'-O)/16S rRNA (cytidine1409-2'-O)-methyltransferase
MGAPKSSKERLDKLLVDKGLCETRSQAQSMVLAGNVLVAGQRVDKPGTLFPPTAEITLKEMPKYVSRGGLKLEQALSDFEISVEGRIAVDVGASTGGFTDCLLQHGATFVHAVDVGYGQLDWKLRQDSRVKVWEKTHINTLTLEQLDPAPTVAVVDVSFISLKKVLPHVVRCLQGPSFAIIALVKPQFEYKDYCAPKGFKGVVTDSADLETILLGVIQGLAEELPMLCFTGIAESPIQGPKGNREFLLYAQGQSVLSEGGSPFLDNLVEQVHPLVFNKP